MILCIYHYIIKILYYVYYVHVNTYTYVSFYYLILPYYTKVTTTLTTYNYKNLRRKLSYHL